MFELDDCSVLITGASGGIGSAIARSLHKQGATVFLTGRNEDALKRTADELGARTHVRVTDLSKNEAINNLVGAASDAMKGIDILVNNAFGQPPFATLEEMDLEAWYASFEINCTSALKMSRAVLPSMREQGKGSIINVATMSIRNNKPMFGAYAAAKSAMTSMTRTMAKEVGPDGIRVNAICPGFIFGESVKWYLQSLADQNDIGKFHLID